MSVSEITDWFLGPKAENADCERAMVVRILENYFEWRRSYAKGDPSLVRGETNDFQTRLGCQVEKMLAALRRDFPSYSPRYIGHMVSDQTLPSVLGYFAGLLYNPNNVTGETSPATLKWELEIGADILRMLGFTPPPEDGVARKTEFGWAHVTSGGTVANLEALWLARNIRYFPLAVQDVCRQCGISIPLNLRGTPECITSLSPVACLGADPAESIDLYARLISSARQHWGLAHSEAIGAVQDLLSNSKYSIAHHGTSAAYNDRPPTLFVSGAKHYSITKAADLLGVGRQNIVLVDVDEHFRMDVRDLRSKLDQALDARSLPIAVIGIAGTTEEGAVDPIHKIAGLRTEIETTRGESFWFHVDAAWGGYLRTLFTPEANAQDWPDADVRSAFEAFPRADSITVDPHKLGYVPYPCGVAAYKNDLVRQFNTEEIPYISDVHFEDTDPRNHRAPRSVGPYILEGSKPGSAVAGCWLSHRMIPLDRSGHGKIVRESLFAARELYQRLLSSNDPSLPYEILPIADQPPDTNVVCFIVHDKQHDGLACTNNLNRWIHRQFTLDSSKPESTPPPFFLSRTTFEPGSYSSAAIRALLDRAHIDPGEYRSHGLFVLRAVVMSPYHAATSENESRPLLAEFLDRLHEQVLAGLESI
jgi:glutamate/tyrosine decarboxylase-like PLP-dependent enzyme